MNLEWKVMDGIGPFFRACPGGKVNWSKIPFTDFEKKWEDAAFISRLYEEFEVVVCSAKEMGVNVLTLDDLAHMVEDPLYGEGLNEKIRRYSQIWERMFEIALGYGIEIWMTTDVIHWNPSLAKSVGPFWRARLSWFKESCREAMLKYPALGGLVLRIGESDGKDVEGDFNSTLMVKTPAQLKALLKELLPLFESHGKTLVLRTWSVGVHPIGDLIWNARTLRRALKGISSPRLILSLKYGESDFFRFLPLNSLFEKTELPLMVEVQGRREYEGAGRFPSFFGYEAEIYRDELLDCPQLKGVMVWCQTGGWTASRRLTFLERNGVWNEINVRTIMSLFSGNNTVEEVLESLHKKVMPELDREVFLRLMRTSHEVIREHWYVEEFALRRLFFRRVRVPPLMGITWDEIWVHPLLGFILRRYSDSSRRILRRGWTAVAKVEEMWEDCDSPDFKEDLHRLRDLMKGLALAREVLLSSKPAEALEELRAHLESRPEHPENYDFKLPDSLEGLKTRSITAMIHLLVREGHRYRLWDHLVTLRIIPLIFPVVYHWKKRSIPKSLRDQAMGVESLFK